LNNDGVPPWALGNLSRKTSPRRTQGFHHGRHRRHFGAVLGINVQRCHRRGNLRAASKALRSLDERARRASDRDSPDASRARSGRVAWSSSRTERGRLTIRLHHRTSYVPDETREVEDGTPTHPRTPLGADQRRGGSAPRTPFTRSDWVPTRAQASTTRTVQKSDARDGSVMYAYGM
jgi:hypothetical protein